VLLLGGGKLNKNHLVTQSNSLIEAKHIKPLTSREQKIILTMVSKIEPEDEDFKDYSISAKEFSQMLGLTGSTKYTELKEVTKRLMSKTIEIPQADGSWLLAHWLASAEYIAGEGEISLSFSPKLKSYLLQLKSQFTSYRLSNILSLNSTYSIRLYELVKKWQYVGKWTCDVETLRGMLGAVGKSYTLYGNFKNKILSPAITEVNEQTDIKLEMTEIKQGRKVTKIEFRIKHIPNQEIKITEPVMKTEKVDLEDMRATLNERIERFNLDQSFFAAIFKDASFIWGEQAEIEMYKLFTYADKDESIRNPLGFIRVRIKEALNLYENGQAVSFSDLHIAGDKKHSRNIIPEWFNNGDDSEEVLDMEEYGDIEKRSKDLKSRLVELSK